MLEASKKDKEMLIEHGLLPRPTLPNPSDVPMHHRIAAAITDADDAFWAEIVKHFPEAKHGDLDPFMVIHHRKAHEDAVRQWVMFNVPSEQP